MGMGHVHSMGMGLDRHMALWQYSHVPMRHVHVHVHIHVHVFIAQPPLPALPPQSKADNPVSWERGRGPDPQSEPALPRLPGGGFFKDSSGVLGGVNSSRILLAFLGST